MINRDLLDNVRSHYHGTEVRQAARCACYYCTRIFPPDEITEWCDDEATALCPNCGVDAVFAEAPDYPITTDLIAALFDRWFNPRASSQGLNPEST